MSGPGQSQDSTDGARKGLNLGRLGRAAVMVAEGVGIAVQESQSSGNGAGLQSRLRSGLEGQDGTKGSLKI